MVITTLILKIENFFAMSHFKENVFIRNWKELKIDLTNKADLFYAERHKYKLNKESTSKRITFFSLL